MPSPARPYPRSAHFRERQKLSPLILAMLWTSTLLLALADFIGTPEWVRVGRIHQTLLRLFVVRWFPKARWLVIVPSAIAGIAGVLTAVGLPVWIGAFSAVGGFLAAVYSAFGESESPIRHRLAANQWTSLRHEARALSETYSKELPHEQFLAEARRIDDRYTTLCQALEPTDKEAFEKARERVKAGLFVPDFREKDTTASKQLNS